MSFLRRVGWARVNTSWLVGAMQEESSDIPSDRVAAKSSWRLCQFRHLHQLTNHTNICSSSAQLRSHGQITEASEINTYETNSTNEVITSNTPTYTQRAVRWWAITTQTRSNTERELAEGLVRTAETVRPAKVIRRGAEVGTTPGETAEMATMAHVWHWVDCIRVGHIRLNAIRLADE
jgi:hypothetical protein